MFQPTIFTIKLKEEFKKEYPENIRENATRIIGVSIEYPNHLPVSYSKDSILLIPREKFDIIKIETKKAITIFKDNKEIHHVIKDKE